MTFSELSAIDAERFRAQVEAEGPRKLFELAEFLRADGVSLDQFDASIASLEPLWAWFMGFARADFPGIPADAQPREEPILLQGARVARASFASEMIVHYLFEVAKRSFHSVAWVTNSRFGMDSFQQTAVQYVEDDGRVGQVHLLWATGTIQGVLQSIHAKYADPAYLADNFLHGSFVCSAATRERIESMPRGESILIPILAGEKPDALEPFVISGPVTPQPQHPHEEADDAGEFLFAHLAADVENLEEAPPLDLATVLNTLVALDVRDLDGNPPTKKSILAEEFAEYTRGDDAQISTLVTGKKLRAVQIAPINPTPETWAEITDAFTAITAPLTARLAPEDEF
ncbi:MAG: hypothetical protein KF727_11810 [Microbacteriaceae bacterium]|nr:hypothetical protein [Microbacteriaceae bacterium]